MRFLTILVFFAVAASAWSIPPMPCRVQRCQKKGSPSTCPEGYRVSEYLECDSLEHKAKCCPVFIHGPMRPKKNEEKGYQAYD